MDREEMHSTLGRVQIPAKESASASTDGGNQIPTKRADSVSDMYKLLVMVRHDRMESARVGMSSTVLIASRVAGHPLRIFRGESVWRVFEKYRRRHALAS